MERLIKLNLSIKIGLLNQTQKQHIYKQGDYRLLL